jgi:hypothetical protein
VIDWNGLGAKLGAALGRALDPLMGDRIRASYAARFGVCRGCAAPLDGPSPTQRCANCHAAEVLARGLGGGPAGNA